MHAGAGPQDHAFASHAGRTVAGLVPYAICIVMSRTSHRNVSTYFRDRMQGKCLVPVKLNEQDGGLVVARHGLCLMVQAPRNEGALQVTDGLALHTHLR